MLANIDLHWFEKAFYHRDGPGSWANARIVRYADDFVVLARWMSPRLVTGLESTWEVRFRLTINREKTKVVLLHHPKTSLDFLGFTLRSDRDRRGRDFGDRNVVPSEKSLGRVRDKLRFLTGRVRAASRSAGWCRISMGTCVAGRVTFGMAILLRRTTR